LAVAEAADVLQQAVDGSIADAEVLLNPGEPVFFEGRI
jgi:hypothetical protein